LVQAKKLLESYGLQFTAVGWPPQGLLDEIINDGPKLNEALDRFCECVTNMGKAGIPILCYAFGLNWGHWRTGLNGGARGDAGVLSFDYELVRDAPLTEQGHVPAEEVWRRFTVFAQRVMPVAEAAGVKLACHPDDPPVPKLRGIDRILGTVQGLKRLIETVPSPSNGLNFCQGTFGESDIDIEDSIRTLVSTERVFVVHFRNVKRLPSPTMRYDEAFIDDGDMDMIATMKLYAQLGYEGLIDPDHAPVMEGDGQWLRERGYAHAIGYMTAVKQMIDRGI
jgi:mannonate dehydratase